MDSEHYQMLEAALKKHDARSDERACEIKEYIKSHSGGATMHGKDEVEVNNIFKSHPGDGLGMGLGAGGLGGGLLGGVLAAALFNRRGGVFGGEGEGGGGAAVNQLTLNQVLTGIGDVKLDVAEQTTTLTNSLGQLALGIQQGFANVKDSVQANSLANLTATTNGTQQVLQAICALGSKIDAGTIANLQAELAEVRGGLRGKEVEVNVTQNVAQAQAQQQTQAQINTLLAQFPLLFAQINRSNQDIVNLGTMVGNTQSSANTNVR